MAGFFVAAFRPTFFATGFFEVFFFLETFCFETFLFGNAFFDPFRAVFFPGEALADFFTFFFNALGADRLRAVPFDLEDRVFAALFFRVAMS